MKKKKMKIWKKILLILTIIIVIAVIGVVSYCMYLKISDKIDIDRRYKEFEEIQTIETKGTMTYDEDEGISKVENMDYITQDGIGVKVDEITLNDDTFTAKINFKFAEGIDVKFGEELKNNPMYFGYAVYDENKNIYYISSRVHTGDNEKYDYGSIFMQRELGVYKNKDIHSLYLADTGGISPETQDENERTMTNKITIGAEDKFPLSQKIYIKIFDLGYTSFSTDENGNHHISNVNTSNAKWLFELDVPEEMNKRDTINLKLSEEIPGITMNKITLTDTKLSLRFSSGDYRNLISEGKDMPAEEFTSKTKEMLSITDGEGNEYKELSGGTRGENEYKMVLEANKNDLDKKLYINYKIGDEQYKSELVKDE